MSKKDFTPIKKMETVWLLRDHTLADASKKSKVSISTIQKWQEDYEQIHDDFHRYLDDESVHKLMLAQNNIANKITLLLESMTEEKVASAPLNQLSSALGVLVDRFLRIQDAKDIEKDTDNTFRVEYQDATTGEVSYAPPWAEDDSTEGETLHNSFMWQTLRENRTRQASDNGNGTERHADLVARTYVSDGESSLARFEDDDEERDWYPN